MAVKKTSALLFRVPLAEYQANIGSLPAYDATNPNAWTSSFDSLFSREKIMSLIDLNYSRSTENEETIYGQGCVDQGDSIVLLDTVDKLTTINATVAQADNEMIAELMNDEYTVVVGSTESVAGESLDWVV